MLANYAPILIFFVIAGAISVVLLAAGFLFGSGRKYADKLAPYECGFDAFEDSRMRFDVRYYLIAILFILFDLEIAFLFPWATVFQEFIAAGEIAWFVFGSVMVFLAVLVIGYVVVQGTRVQLAWRQRVEEGDVDAIQTLVAEEVNRWKTARMPKGMQPSIWHGVQSAELLEVTPDSFRLSASAERLKW